MNRSPDVEPVLRAFFADDGLTAPDNVLDVVADRVSRQPQRGSWRLLVRQPMNTYAKLAAGLAAVLIAAFVAWNLLPGQSGIGDRGATPTPGPSQASKATPMPTFPWWSQGVDCGDGPTLSRAQYGCAGDLAAGTHQSVGLIPSVRFAVPPGWINVQAWATRYVLMPDTDVTRGGREQSIAIIPDVPVPEKESCAGDPAARPGTATQLLAAILAADGVDVTAPTPITVGALSGQWVDLQLSAGWTATCPDDPSTPVALVPNWTVREGERDRFIVLDASRTGVRNILIMLVAADSAAFELLAADGMSIVESFEFDLTPS